MHKRLLFAFSSILLLVLAVSCAAVATKRLNCRRCCPSGGWRSCRSKRDGDSERKDCFRRYASTK